MDNGNLFVTLIQGENFLKLQKVEFHPRPGVNMFKGLNKAGKSDIIRLFKAAFEGAGAEVISHGKDKSTIFVRISDGHEIRRTITEKSQRCQVLTPTGDIKAAPQKFLDSILGTDLRFDPIAFALKEPKEQKQMLLETFHIGRIEAKMLEGFLEEDDIGKLDFKQDGLAVLKEAERLIYGNRTIVNKEAANHKATYEGLMAKITGFNPEEYETKFGGDRRVSIQMNIDEQKKKLSDAEAIQKQVEKASVLVKQLTVRNEEAQREADDIGDFKFLNTGIATIEDEIDRLQKRLEELKEELLKVTTAKRKKENLLKEIAVNKTTLDNLPRIQDIPDMEPIKKSLSEFEEELRINNEEAEKYSIYKQAKATKAKYDDYSDKSHKLTEILDVKLRKELPEQIMDKQDMPFKSLHFDGDEPIIDGNRISLMATSEQLMLGLQIFHERNKDTKLKVLCADRIESLDNDSYNQVVAFCNEHKYQTIFIKVETAPMPEDAVLVEDGEIK